jgi:hypothetical protein
MSGPRGDVLGRRDSATAPVPRLLRAAPALRTLPMWRPGRTTSWSLVTLVAKPLSVGEGRLVPLLDGSRPIHVHREHGRNLRCFAPHIARPPSAKGLLARHVGQLGCASGARGTHSTDAFAMAGCADRLLTTGNCERRGARSTRPGRLPCCRHRRHDRHPRPKRDNRPTYSPARTSSLASTGASPPGSRGPGSRSRRAGSGLEGRSMARVASVTISSAG